jgi:alpha-galactosidase
MHFTRGFIYMALCLVLGSCRQSVRVQNGNLLLEINNLLETRVSNIAPAAKPLMDKFTSSEYLVCKKFEAKMFPLKSSEKESVTDKHGHGQRKILTGLFEHDGYAIRKIMEVTVYDSFPDMAFLRIQYVNSGLRDIEVTKWVNNCYKVNSAGDAPAFWSFQGSSTQERRDWMLPVDSSFSQKNYMGMNNTDYGGGIPVLDLWRKDAGIAIGHTELIPRMVSLPVEKDKYDSWAKMDIEYEYSEPLSFKTGDTLKTYMTFVSVHT